MNTYLKIVLGILFLAAMTFGMTVGLRLVTLPGAVAKIGGTCVLGATGAVAYIGVYSFLGIGPEDHLL